MMLRILGNILCNPKVKVKDTKRVYAMVYHRLKSSFHDFHDRSLCGVRILSGLKVMKLTLCSYWYN